MKYSTENEGWPEVAYKSGPRDYWAIECLLLKVSETANELSETG